jgi:hypothetical protein
MVFASNLGDAQISIRATTDQLSKDLNKAKSQVQSSLQGIQQKMKGFGTAASIGITAPLALFGKQAFQAAADAEEMESKLDVVFGKAADDVRKWADETAKAVGRSSNELRTAAADTQSLLISAGVGAEQAQKMSTALAQLAIDTASFNNASDPQAIQAFQKALLGENEMLKSVGFSLSAAEVQRKALELGYKGSVAQMDAATKAEATFAALLEKTSQAQGDAARTIGSSSNQMKVLNAAMQDLSIVIGQQLLPALTPIITALADALRWFVDLGPEVTQFTVIAAGLAAALGPLALILGSVSLPIVAITAALGAGVVAWQKWGDAIETTVRNTVQKVVSWFDKLKGPVDWVNEKIDTINDTFFKLYDDVVGHSYVPDLVDEIGYQFDRLDQVMVKPTLDATKKVSNEFKGLMTGVGGGLAQGLSSGVGSAFSSLSSGISDPVAGAFLGPVMGALGGQIQSGIRNIFPSVGKALGGPIGKPTLVGERGPELFVPGQAGTIVSNSNLGGGAVINQNINLMPDVGERFKEQLSMAMPVIRQAAVDANNEFNARRGRGGF